MIPNLMLRELGNAAAKYNQRTTEHASTCCQVCRRLLVDLVVALTDPANWQPEPVANQLQKMREEMDALQKANATLVQNLAARTPMEAVPTAEELGLGMGGPPPGAYFPPTRDGEE